MLMLITYPATSQRKLLIHTSHPQKYLYCTHITTLYTTYSREGTLQYVHKRHTNKKCVSISTCNAQMYAYIRVLSHSIRITDTVFLAIYVLYITWKSMFFIHTAHATIQRKCIYAVEYNCRAPLIYMSL